MANERRSGGRGGVATDAPGLDLGDFVVVKKDQELSRSDLPPSQYTPLVELARANLNQKIERTRVVMDPETSEPRTHEDGTPIREPITYTKAEAQAFKDELRAAADRLKITKVRQSLRIVMDPKLDKAPDEGPIRVQFYVIPMGGSQDGNQS
jgi:hypothetical protein